MVSDDEIACGYRRDVERGQFFGFSQDFSEKNARGSLID
jgi:hypothetical protein